MPLFDADKNELAVGQLIYDDVFDKNGRVDALGGDLAGEPHSGHVRVQFHDGDTMWRTCGHIHVRAQRSSPRRSSPAVAVRASADSGAPNTAPALEHAGAPAAPEPEPKRARVTLNNYFTSRTSSISRVESRGGGPSTLSASEGARASTSAAVMDLTMPELAAHERDRAAKVKPPSKGMGTNGKAKSNARETSVPITRRLLEFPDQSFVASAGVLFCKACKERLVNTTTQIKQHVNTKKHETALKKFQSSSDGDSTRAELLSEYFRVNPQVAQSTVPHDVQVFRMRVVEGCMQAGIALAKLDILRPVIERADKRLTDSSHLRSLYVPIIEEHEFTHIKEEVKDQHVAFIWDGTAREGDAQVMVIRWCTESFELEQRLCAFITLAVHADAKALAGFLFVRLCKELDIDPAMLIAAIRDSVAVNTAALSRITPMLTNSTDVLCVCHTFSNGGDKFEFEVLGDFMTNWYVLVCNQVRPRKLWEAMIGEPAKGFSNVRWWCRAEIQIQIAKSYNYLRPFVNKLVELEIGGASTTKMAAILADESKERRLCLEFAAMLDMEAFVSATYELEGDRLEILVAHSRITALREMGRRLSMEGAMPNLEAALRRAAMLGPGVIIKKGPFIGKVSCACVPSLRRRSGSPRRSTAVRPAPPCRDVSC
mmetsp:Transcript_18603/g.54510  ORF Transcript_18603/g.54510 Transcript_18603/m.54510 type:complete len:655 (+) Transcript_18603:97-2061(+)